MDEPKPGEIYKHFKGEDMLKKIITIAKDCENPEQKLVVYEQLYETPDFPIGTIWVRTLKEFCGFKTFDKPTTINTKEFKEGDTIKRFTFVE